MPKSSPLPTCLRKRLSFSTQALTMSTFRVCTRLVICSKPCAQPRRGCWTKNAPLCAKPCSLYFGTIHNASSMRSSSCLVAIRDRLSGLIREHEPDCCALESVIYVQSYKTAIILGAARGAAILAAAENGLPIFEYSPRRIKQSTVGRGAAGKDQVAFMVRALLGLIETPDADAADALAIGLTHLRSQDVARLGIPGATQI